MMNKNSKSYHLTAPALPEQGVAVWLSNDTEGGFISRKDTSGGLIGGYGEG